MEGSYIGKYIKLTGLNTKPSGSFCWRNQKFEMSNWVLMGLIKQRFKFSNLKCKIAMTLGLWEWKQVDH